MKITKLGHCCLLIEEGGLQILTDPGAWTKAQNKVKGVGVILITHEHPDHLHTDSVREILTNNPGAKIFTVQGVKKILKSAGIESFFLGHQAAAAEKGVRLEGFGQKHADIYEGVPVVDNTGYRIGKRFFYPGDAFFEPPASVEILALPVCGPWMKISEAIDYAKQIKPRVCIPVHDGMLGIAGAFHLHPQRFLREAGIDFVIPQIGIPMTF